MIPPHVWRLCDDGERYVYGGGLVGPIAPRGVCVRAVARCEVTP